MNLHALALLTNENVHPRVIEWFRVAGFNVISAPEAALCGAADEVVLRRASLEQRVVVTHDADFGRLAIADGVPVFGIVYLRPGHIDPEFTIESLETLLRQNPDVTPPFIIIARRSGRHVRVRIRELR